MSSSPPGTLCCVFGQDILLSVPLSFQVYKWVLGTEADPGFFLGGGAPLRNGVTDW